MSAAIRLVRGGWPAAVERPFARFVRDDARVLPSSDVSPDVFRRVMSSVHVGQTIKITGSDRHRKGDQLLLQHVDCAGQTIVDLGASDGSTSLDLIAKLPDFGAYVIADLYLYAEVLERGRRLYLYDQAGECVLVAGPRLVAWPGLSKPVRLLYGRLLRSADERRQERRRLLLLNPEVQRLMRQDSRISYRVHDVFEPWDGTPPGVIKVANLLRRLYFDDASIVRALRALHASLPEGG